MKCLVTGASGFIGKYLVDFLHNQNHEVIPLAGRDLFNVRYHSALFEDISTIYHLAAYGNHYFEQNSIRILLDNFGMAVKLLEMLKYFNIEYQKFYNFSSSSVSLAVQTPYSISKKATELLAEIYPNVVNIRPYSVYGPGEAEHRFIPKIIRHLHSGEFMEVDCYAYHDWIYVKDFTQAIHIGYTEVGTGISTSNLSIIRMLEDISGKQLNFTRVEKLRTYDNNEWKCPIPIPCTGIYEGLKLTYEQNRTKSNRTLQKA